MSILNARIRSKILAMKVVLQNGLNYELAARPLNMLGILSHCWWMLISLDSKTMKMS